MVKNSSKFATPPWQYNPIEKNLLHLSKFLLESKDSKLVITTSRPDSEKENIKQFLQEKHIWCYSIITGLPHSKRILINDFSNSNPYPSCSAISIPRDSENLFDFI